MSIPKQSTFCELHPSRSSTSNQLFLTYYPRTLNEYADNTERLTGRKVNRNYLPRSQILKKWEQVKKENPYYVLRLAADSPAGNFVGRSHNELLNPSEKYFKPESWEETVKAVSVRIHRSLDFAPRGTFRTDKTALPSSLYKRKEVKNGIEKSRNILVLCTKQLA